MQKNGHPFRVAVKAIPTAMLFQGGRYSREFARQIRADGCDGADDDDRDQTGDQTIFDSRRAGFVANELPNDCRHGALLIECATPLWHSRTEATLLRVNISQMRLLASKRPHAPDHEGIG